MKIELFDDHTLSLSPVQSSRMDFMLRLPNCTDKHQILMILTNPTSDIWILHLTKADVLTWFLEDCRYPYTWKVLRLKPVQADYNAVDNNSKYTCWKHLKMQFLLIISMAEGTTAVTPMLTLSHQYDLWDYLWINQQRFSNCLGAE